MYFSNNHPSKKQTIVECHDAKSYSNDPCFTLNSIPRLYLSIWGSIWGSIFLASPDGGRNMLPQMFPQKCEFTFPALKFREETCFPRCFSRNVSSLSLLSNFGKKYASPDASPETWVYFPCLEIWEINEYLLSPSWLSLADTPWFCI